MPEHCVMTPTIICLHEAELQNQSAIFTFEDIMAYWLIFTMREEVRPVKNSSNLCCRFLIIYPMCRSSNKQSGSLKTMVIMRLKKPAGYMSVNCLQTDKRLNRLAAWNRCTKNDGVLRGGLFIKLAPANLRLKKFFILYSTLLLKIGKIYNLKILKKVLDVWSILCSYILWVNLILYHFI